MTQSKLAKSKWTYYPLNSKDGATFNSQKAMTDNVRVKHEHTTGKGIELVRNFKNKENTFSTYLVYVGNGSNRKLVGTCKREKGESED